MSQPAHGKKRAITRAIAAALTATAVCLGLSLSGCADREDLANIGLSPYAQLAAAADLPKENFKETVNTLDLDMVYVKGGTFKMGCSDGDDACGPTEKSQHEVTIDYDYFIGKYQVTNALWDSVMGPTTYTQEFMRPQPQAPKTGVTWYDAIEFTCKLSQMTGKKYRLATEAEWEFAARGGTKTKNYLYSGSNDFDDVAWHSGSEFPDRCMSFGGGFGGSFEYCMAGSGPQVVGLKKANELGIYDMSGNVYEWTADNWASTFGSAAVTNPLAVHKHTQKTRRGGSAGQPASESRNSGRKIRSIEGKDGEIGIRLALSVADSRPTNMPDPCDIHQPPPTRGLLGLRDTRLVTGDTSLWVNDYGTMMAFSENGAAIIGMAYEYGGRTYISEQAAGEWYTLNSFSLHIVKAGAASDSANTSNFIYYLVSNDELSMMGTGMVSGRFERVPIADVKGGSAFKVPTIASIRPADQLAPASGTVDMSNPPETEQDPRLIEGTTHGWWQNNASAGGTHHYRKDFNDTPNYMRFVVYDRGAGSSVLLAEGEWFTINNCFLRVKGTNGYNYDYLYTVTGTSFSHISYQSYEPGDMRMFTKTENDKIVNWFEPTGTLYFQGASTYLTPTVDGKEPSSIKERGRIVR